MGLGLLVMMACEPTSGPSRRPTYRPPASKDPALQASWSAAQSEVEAALAADDPTRARSALVAFQREIVAAEQRGVANQSDIDEARRYISYTMERVGAEEERKLIAQSRETVDGYLAREAFNQAYDLVNFFCVSQADSSDALLRYCEQEPLRVETAEVDWVERQVQEFLAQRSYRSASGMVGVYLNARDFSDLAMARLESLQGQIDQARTTVTIATAPPPPPPSTPPGPRVPRPVNLAPPTIPPPDVRGLVFAYVPSRTYTVGTPRGEPGRDGVEPEPGQLPIEGFFISQTEVTQEAFKSAVPTKTWKTFSGPKLPAHSVTFEEAEQFCVTLTLQDDRMIFSLPTETEWEVAARAGNPPEYGPIVGKPNHQARFLTGLDEAAQALQNYAIFADNKLGPGPGPVSQKSANPLGLFDMHGNVAEWCRREPRLPDLYRNVILERPLRGGSVQSPYERCRAGARALEPATTSTPTIGFRIIARPR